MYSLSPEAQIPFFNVPEIFYTIFYNFFSGSKNFSIYFFFAVSLPFRAQQQSEEREKSLCCCAHVKINH
jgi:hypothetical protein